MRVTSTQVSYAAGLIKGRNLLIVRTGRQDVPEKGSKECLKYGVSITDGCVGWDETEVILERLAAAVRQRQGASAENSVSDIDVDQSLMTKKHTMKNHVVELLM